MGYQPFVALPYADGTEVSYTDVILAIEQSIMTKLNKSGNVGKTMVLCCEILTSSFLTECEPLEMEHLRESL